MWFAACHYQKSFKQYCRYTSTTHQLTRIHIILAQQFHGRPIDSPDSSKKLPVAFCLRLLVLPAVAREDADPRASDLQQRAWRDSWVGTGRRLAVTVWSYKETARLLLATTVVGDSARMNICRSVSSAVRPRMYVMRCFQCWSLLNYWCSCSAILT